jgi:hypothetical protein
MKVKNLGSVVPNIQAHITVNGEYLGSCYDAPNPIGGLLARNDVKLSDTVLYEVESLYYTENETLTVSKIKNLLSRGVHYNIENPV